MILNKEIFGLLISELGFNPINKIIYKYYNDKYVAINERGTVYIGKMKTVLNTNGSIEVNFEILFDDIIDTYDLFVKDIEYLEKKNDIKIDFI